MEPSEFKVLGSDWTGPDLIIDTCNSLLKFRIRSEKRECSLYHWPFFLIYNQHISDPNFQEPCLFALLGQILLTSRSGVERSLWDQIINRKTSHKFLRNDEMWLIT